MNARTKQEHSIFMSKIVEHRAALYHVQYLVTHETSNLHEKLDAMSHKLEATQGSVMSLRNVGEQLMTFIGTFPIEIRDLLRNILRNNWQMYQVLLAIQRGTSRTRTSVQASNIRFTNALEEYRELPYEYFCQWEVSCSRREVLVEVITS